MWILATGCCGSDAIEAIVSYEIVEAELAKKAFKLSDFLSLQLSMTHGQNDVFQRIAVKNWVKDS